MNYIYVKKCSDFSELGMDLMAVLWQSLMTNHQLRVRNSPKKSEVKMENCSPFGVISNPNQLILDPEPI